MNFWDTSAIIPLLVDEPGSGAMRSLLAADDLMVVWWGTLVECRSAVARRQREGGLAREVASQALERLACLRAAWVEVLPTGEVRDQAIRLLQRHPLRAADALQLGAAGVASGGKPEGMQFVTLDGRLAEAARLEAFQVWGE